MYEFWYDYIKPKYEEKKYAKWTEISLIACIKTEDICT